MTIQIGHVEAVFRYPVKSTGGERMNAANIGWRGEEGMYGLIGRMIAVPGQRDALIAILLDSTHSDAKVSQLRGGARSGRSSGVRVTGIWDSPESRQQGGTRSLPRR